MTDRLNILQSAASLSWRLSCQTHPTIDVISRKRPGSPWDHMAQDWRRLDAQISGAYVPAK